jgi:hypothetical protein
MPNGLSARVFRLFLDGRGASTAPNLIDALSRDARDFDAATCRTALNRAVFVHPEQETFLSCFKKREIDAGCDIVQGYTPEQREVAITLAKALRWETPEEEYDIDVDHF